MLYFCLNTLLDEIEGHSDLDEALSALASVHDSPPECRGYPQDAFIMKATPEILDLDDPEAAKMVEKVMEEIPLYKVNLELVLDEILAQRHNDSKILMALEKIFSGQPLPTTLEIPDDVQGDLTGSLRHPMIAHADTLYLCDIYLKFLKLMGTTHPEYNFKNAILGGKTALFTQHYDGFFREHDGQIKAGVLIENCRRQDHDPLMPVEMYVSEGQDKANQMKIEDPQEILWAWLEADNFQMRRCYDIHRVKKNIDLDLDTPWLKVDVFSLLSREAMKQVFAKNLLDKDATLKCAEGMPSVQAAIKENESGNVHDLLQQLLSQTLSVDGNYSGAAGKFYEIARERNKEAKAKDLA